MNRAALRDACPRAFMVLLRTLNDSFHTVFDTLHSFLRKLISTAKNSWNNLEMICCTLDCFIVRKQVLSERKRGHPGIWLVF